jgi:Yip1-like protein
MITALMLIFEPVDTWEKIVQTNRSAVTVFFLHLLPMMVLSLGFEAFALIQWGETRSLSGELLPVPHQAAQNYCLAHFVFLLVVIFLGARILQKLAQSFHSAHTYSQCFITLAYSLSPLFLGHVLDAWYFVDTWVCWGLGATLSVAVLYQGLPRIMKPDPSVALGIYIVSSVLILILAGAEHYLAWLVLHEYIHVPIPALASDLGLLPAA